MAKTWKFGIRQRAILPHVMKMEAIGIIGARVAGSYLAWLLSRSGFKVLLFDHRTEKEKACGGGLTYKAYNRVPGLEDDTLPRSRVDTMILINHRYPFGIRSTLNPPLVICARKDLDGYLRQRAIASGAVFCNVRVEDIRPQEKGWEIQTRAGSYESDFLVGADGTRSLLKSRFDKPFAKEDLSLALGYYVPGRFHSDTIQCRFFPAPFQGYLWSFPRQDHLSVGIIDSMAGADPAAMRVAVDEQIRNNYPQVDPSECRDYAAPVPALRVGSLKSNRVAGSRWAVVGDAAGFADAITGEGIFYALRSSEILAECLQQGRPEEYPKRCRLDFGRELLLAARLKKYFYGRRVGSRSLSGLAVALAAGSERFRRLLAEWTAGHVPYSSMLLRFAAASPRLALELARHSTAKTPSPQR